MFNLPSIRLGRIFGIPLEVNPTWLIVFALVATSLSFGYFPDAFPGRSRAVDVASGFATALLFFASIVAHEMSHSLVARAGGVRIRKVTLFIFGGVAQMEEEPHSPTREFTMAIAGPGMSLLLAASFAMAAVVLHGFGVSDVVWGPLEYLAIINVSVALFNLLPGFPLDGGRVLRAILWGATGSLLKATRWASRAGQLIGYSLVAAAVVGVVLGTLDLIWLGLVGWFISVLADSAYRQQVARSDLHQFSVRSLMTPSPAVVPGDITLDRFVHGYLLSGSHSRYPVALQGSVVGLVSLADVKAIPQDQWDSRTVADVANKDLRRLVVDADGSGDVVFDRLAGEDPGALLAVADGRLVGIVTRADVLARVRRA